MQQVPLKIKKCFTFLLIAFSLCLHSQTITTIAGTGVQGYGGDSANALAAHLNYPYAISKDGAGNIFFADWFNHRVRKIDQNGIITTVAGTGTSGFSGDSALAVYAELRLPTGVCVDNAGNIFVSDYGNKRLRKIDTTGTITTIAGTGSNGFSGDGGPATLAELYSPINIALDNSDNIFIADMNNNRIRKINTNGIISTVAGIGTAGYSGDGGQAVAAQLSGPQGITVDKNGNLFIADSYNHCIRKVNSSGIITTIAGTGGVHGYSGDGGSAANAEFYLPSDINVDSVGNIYIVDEINCCIRKINKNNLITTIAGTGTFGISADGGLAENTALYYPKGMEVKNGTIYISDTQSNRIRTFIENDPNVSIDELKTAEPGINIYPNPCKSKLIIDLPVVQEFEFEIYNTLGCVVLSEKNHTNGSEIIISALREGLYYYKVKTQKREYTGRLVKEK